MHELSLVQGMMEQLTEMKKKYQLKEITDVHLTIGEISGVDSRFFQSAFDMFAPTTSWSKLKIHIQNEPWSIRCKDCSHEQNVSDWNNECGKCGSKDTETIKGSEFIIQRIEGDSNV